MKTAIPAAPSIALRTTLLGAILLFGSLLWAALRTFSHLPFGPTLGIVGVPSLIAFGLVAAQSEPRSKKGPEGAIHSRDRSFVAAAGEAISFELPGSHEISFASRGSAGSGLSGMTNNSR